MTTNAQTGSNAVVLPSYDKSKVKPGIAHFGPGNFHRGHFAVIMNNYMARTGDLDWGIVGITLHDPHKAEKLRQQNFSYHVVERSEDSCTVERIDSILDILHAPNDKKAVIDLLASPDIKVISMTITQKGYLNPEGGFESGDPTTVAGYIVHALEKRRQMGIPAPTLMSCDNIPNNGAELKKAVLLHAQAPGFAPELVEWIGNNVRFPDTMVDRIVPATRAEDTQWLKQNYDIDDANAIFTEPFRNFVIQTRFSGPFPDINRPEKGIVMLPEMGDYELMKIRMLNGTHFALGVIGTLAGYTYIDEALKDPAIREFADSFMREAANSLKPIPGINFDDYRQRLFKRFENPFMKDELVRLARNGSDKLNPRVLDVARDLAPNDFDYRHMAFVSAAWAHYIKGRNGKGQEFDILDEKAIKNGWQDIARLQSPAQYLFRLRPLFGKDMIETSPFRHAFHNYYMMIQHRGVMPVVRAVPTHAPVKGQVMQFPVPKAPHVPTNQLP